MRHLGLTVAVVLLAGACGEAATVVPADTAATTPSSTSTSATTTTTLRVTTTSTQPPELLKDGAVSVIRDVPFTPALSIDVFTPVAPGPWPVVVLFHGGGWAGGAPEDMVPLATALAAGGAVVFNAPYRLALGGGGYPSTFEDAACAVRFGRQRARRFGGDPAVVAVVGYSAGAHIGAVTALAGDSFSGDCSIPAGSAFPDVFVGVAGPYDTDLLDPLLAMFFGTDRAVDPRPWEDGNPFTHIGGNPDLRVRLVHGEEDRLVPAGFATSFAEALEEEGYDVALTLVPGGTHGSVVDPNGDAALTIDTILGAVG